MKGSKISNQIFLSKITVTEVPLSNISKFRTFPNWVWPPSGFGDTLNMYLYRCGWPSLLWWDTTVCNLDRFILSLNWTEWNRMEWMQVNKFSRPYKNKLQKNRSWYSCTILNQNKLSTQSEPISRWKYILEMYTRWVKCILDRWNV